MNFGSEYALHDSDDEEEEVREDTAPNCSPLPPLSAASAAVPAQAPPELSVGSAALQQHILRRPPPKTKQPNAGRGRGKEGRALLSFGGAFGGGGAPGAAAAGSPPLPGAADGYYPVDEAAMPSYWRIPAAGLGNGLGRIATGGGVAAAGVGEPLVPPPAMPPAGRPPLPVFETVGGGSRRRGEDLRAGRTCYLPPSPQPPSLFRNVPHSGFFSVPSAEAAPATHAEGANERASMAAPGRLPSSTPLRTWTRKVDTNILNVDMAALGNAAPFATGDPTFCSGCQACLSIVSILRPSNRSNNKTSGVTGDGSTSDPSQSAGASGATRPTLGNLPEENSQHFSASGESMDVGGDDEGVAAGATSGDGGQEQGEDGVYDWTCEFCATVNTGIELDDMEKPAEGQDSIDYVLEPAPVSAAAAGANVSNRKGGGESEKQNESAVLFVIDTSGSMCVTTAVDGRLTLRGDHTKDLRHLLEAGDSNRQEMPGQRRGITYISRLQSMQAAIDAQLEVMAKSTPSRLAGIVTFNGEVSLIGDGSSDARVVAGDRLSDSDALREVGRAYPLSQPVSQARDRLADRLFALEEGGPTALGPAVVAGLSMLKERGGRGSRMVVCTDGLANVGLGSLDDLKTDEERTVAEAFYEKLGRESAENGVTVDVVSVDSDACDLENLGALSDMSGGTVTRVKATELATNFAGILANPILASQVSVRVTLHKGLMFRNAGTKRSINTLDKDVGNVTRETELTFEYQVRPKIEREALGLTNHGVLSSAVRHKENSTEEVPNNPTRPSPSLEPPPVGGAEPEINQESATAAAAAAAAAAPTDDNDEKSLRAYLPFQVQIRYTRPDGMKCVRVLTKTQRVTRCKRRAERSMKMAVVAGHATAQAGLMAQRGAYHSTRVSMRAWDNVMRRNVTDAGTSAQVNRYGSEMSRLDTELCGAQRTEGIVDHDMGGAVNEELESRMRGRARKSARSTNNDSLSHMSFAAKGAGSKDFRK